MKMALSVHRRLAVLLTALVAVADGYANSHHQAWGDWLAAALFAYMSAYCTQNFLRCREVHCAITAPGFLAAAVLMLLRLAGVMTYGYGIPWAVFVVSACCGYCVQELYQRRTGSIFFHSDEDRTKKNSR